MNFGTFLFIFFWWWAVMVSITCVAYIISLALDNHLWNIGCKTNIMLANKRHISSSEVTIIFILSQYPNAAKERLYVGICLYLHVHCHCSLWHFASARWESSPKIIREVIFLLLHSQTFSGEPFPSHHDVTTNDKDHTRSPSVFWCQQQRASVNCKFV